MVIQIDAQSMVVITASGQFRRLPLPPEAPRPGQTIEVEIPAPKYWRPGFYLAAAALIALILLASWLNPFGLAPAVASVYLDMVPQVGLTVDKDLKVREVQALNDQGLQVIKQADLRGLEVTAAVEQVTARAMEMGYLRPEETNFIFATVVNREPDGKTSGLDPATLQQVIHNLMASRNMTGYVVVNSADQIAVEQAARAELPVTSYVVLEQAAQNGVDLAPEQVKEKTLREVLNNTPPATVERMFPGAWCGRDGAGGPDYRRMYGPGGNGPEEKSSPDRQETLPRASSEPESRTGATPQQPPLPAPTEKELEGYGPPMGPRGMMHNMMPPWMP